MIKALIKNFLNEITWKKDPSGKLYYEKITHGEANIGHGCTFIGRNISFSSEPYLIKIGNNVRVSFDVCFVTHDGGTYVLRKDEPEICIYGPIVVGDNVFIGARSIIMPNITIGSNSIVGAGSVVTKNIPDNQIWAGVPAKFICSINEYRTKNEKKFSFIVNKPYEEKKKILCKYFYK